MNQAHLPFQGKCVIVTGASMGIGKELAYAFCEAGATVVMCARSEHLLRDAAAAGPNGSGRLLPFAADVTEEGAVRRLVEFALEAAGRIDILVNNAGMGVNGSVEELPIDAWRKVIEVNLIAPVRCIQAVLPVMKRQGGGQVIQISSVAGRVSVPYVGGYSATKFGLNAISDALRIEAFPAGIQVISVYPSTTESNFRANALGERKWPKVRPGAVSSRAVALRVVQASLRGERDVYIRQRDRFICWFGERFPRLSDWILKRLYRLH